MSEYVTIYTDTGPMQVKREELEKKYTYNEQTRRWNPKPEQPTQQTYSTVYSGRQEKITVNGRDYWVLVDRSVQLDDDLKNQIAENIKNVVSSGGVVHEIMLTAKGELVMKYQTPQGATEQAVPTSKTPEQAVAERFQTQSAGIPLTTPYVVQTSELQKILASGKQVYYVPLENDAKYLASEVGVYKLQQLPDFIGFGVIDGKAVAIFSQNVENINSIINDVKTEVARVTISNMSGMQKAATALMMASQPEGYKLIGSIVAQKLGLPIGQAPEEIVLEKMESVMSQTHDAVFYVKSGVKTLASPLGMPTTGYAGGVLSQAAVRLGNFATATMSGVSAALTGAAVASTTVDAMQNRYENVLGNVFALTQAAFGYSVGAAQMKNYMQLKEAEYAARTIQEQLKGGKFMESVGMKKIEGGMEFKTLDQVKSTTFMHDLARTQSHMIARIGKPDYWVEGAVNYHGSVIRSDAMSSVIDVKYEAATALHFDRWWGKGVQIDVGAGRGVSFSKVLLKQPGEVLSASLTRSGSSVSKGLSNVYDFLDDLKYIRFVTDKNVVGYGFSKIESGFDISGTGRGPSVTTVKTIQTALSSTIQSIKPNVEIVQVGIRPMTVPLTSTTKTNTQVITLQKQTESTQEKSMLAIKSVQNMTVSVKSIEESRSGVSTTTSYLSSQTQANIAQNTVSSAMAQLHANMSKIDLSVSSVSSSAQKASTAMKTFVSNVAPAPRITTAITPKITMPPVLLSTLPLHVGTKSIVPTVRKAISKQYRSMRIYKPSIYALSFRISDVKGVVAKDVIRPLRWLKR